MDYAKIAEVIDHAVQQRVEKMATHIRLGTVATVHATTVEVVIDGSSAPSTLAKACTCVKGDRVVIIREGTQFYAIARLGG